MPAKTYSAKKVQCTEQKKVALKFTQYANAEQRPFMKMHQEKYANKAGDDYHNMHKTKVTIVLLIIVTLNVYFVPPVCPQTETTITVHFIDVGQGDSIFIDTANRDVLIDAGPKTATQTVLNYLANLNITQIHLVIATHAHEDHIGGLVGVINSNITIDTILYNNQTHTSATYTNFITASQTHNLTVAQRGQIYMLTETVNLYRAKPCAAQ